MDTIMQLGTTRASMFWQALPPSCDTSKADLIVPCHNRMGSILYRKKATRCNNGDEILPYMLRLIFLKNKIKFYGPSLCIFLFYFFETQ
jgi:hypothetical protein